VKAIFRSPLNQNLIVFEKEKGLTPVAERLEELFETYLAQALVKNNPLIFELAKEYKRGFLSRTISKTTPCCCFRYELFAFLISIGD
jgi:hypothetical protein